MPGETNGFWKELVRAAVGGASQAFAAIFGSALVLGLIGAAAGWWFGGPIGAIAGLVVGAIVGAALALAVFSIINSV